MNSRSSRPVFVSQGIERKLEETLENMRKNIMDKKNESIWNDTRWMELRAKIFARDDYKCRYCGRANVPIIGHHLAYVKGKCVWEYPEEMIVTLCIDCHEKHHAKYGVRKFPTVESALKVLEEEKKSEATISVPSPDLINVTVAPVSATTTQPPAKKLKKRKKNRYLTSCTTGVERKFYEELLSLSDKTEMTISTIVRPFVDLIKLYMDEIATCRSESEITKLVHSKFA